MDTITIKSDVTRREDGAYWAAALILAIGAGDNSRANLARRNLRRLGYTLEQIPARRGKVAKRGR